MTARVDVMAWDTNHFGFTVARLTNALEEDPGDVLNRLSDVEEQELRYLTTESDFRT